MINFRCLFLDYLNALHVLQNLVAFFISFRNFPTFSTSKQLIILGLGCDSFKFYFCVADELWTSWVWLSVQWYKKSKSTKTAALISSEINLHLPPASFMVGIFRVWVFQKWNPIQTLCSPAQLYRVQEANPGDQYWDRNLPRSPPNSGARGQLKFSET